MREDGHLSGTECRINKKKGADRKREKEACGDPVNHFDHTGEPNWDHITEGQKSKAESKAEHIFGIAKGLFGFRKAGYRGLKKNPAKLWMLFAGIVLEKLILFQPLIRILNTWIQSVAAQGVANPADLLSGVLLRKTPRLVHGGTPGFRRNRKRA
jgi:hypothetical protein